MTKPNPLATWRTKIWEYSPRIDLLSEAEKAWLAAVIDCEGTISYVISNGKRGPKLHITVANMNLELLHRIQELIGAGEVRPHPPTGVGKQLTWNYRLHDYGNVYRLLQLLFPHLIVKRNRAKLALEFLNLRHSPDASFYYTEKELDVVERMKLLKYDERRNIRRLFY